MDAKLFIRLAYLLLSLCGSASAETVLLDFTADWCAGCKEMRPVVAQLVKEGYTVRTLDCTLQTSKAAAEASRRGITTIPCFIVDVGRNEFERVSGPTTAKKLRAILKRGKQAEKNKQPRRLDIRELQCQDGSCAVPWGNQPMFGGYSAPTYYGRMPSQPAQPVEQSPPIAAVVRISNTVPKGNRNEISWGSGTLVDKCENESEGMVITCAHLFTGEVGTITVHFPGGQKRQALLVDQDSNHDLAALAVVDPPTEPIAVAEQYASAGDATKIAGYGSGSFRVASGRVSGYLQKSGTDSAQNMVVAVTARQGDSGGPILNERGELTAVLWGSVPNETHGTCCLKIRDFLKRIRSRWCRCKPQQPAEGPVVTKPPIDVTSPADKPVASKPDCDCADCNCTPCRCDNEKLLAEISSLKAQLAAIKPFDPKTLKPIHVRLVDQHGKVKASGDVPLGGTMTLKLVPVSRPSK